MDDLYVRKKTPKKRKKKVKIDYDMSGEKVAIVRQNGVCITPFEPHANNKYSLIERMTSEWNDITYTRTPYTGYTLTHDNVGTFVCTKFDIGKMRNMLPAYRFIEEPIWNAHKMFPAPIQMNLEFTPSPIQKYAIEKYDDIRTSLKKSVFLQMPTASGKTLLGIFLAAKFGKRTLILCFKDDILAQWKKSLLTFTDCQKDQIKIYSSSADIMKDYERYDGFYTGPSFVLMTTSLCRSFIDMHGPEKFTDVMKQFGFGLMVFDEAHKHLGNIIKINGLVNIRRTIYLSADFGRSERIANEYYEKAFANVPIIRPPDELVEDFKYTYGVVVKYNSEPDMVDKDTCFNRRGYDEHNYMRYQLRKGVFINVMDELLQMIMDRHDEGMKILIFLNLIEQIDYFLERYTKMYPELKISALYRTMSAEEKSMLAQNSDIIISTYKLLDTGTDMQCIKHIISTTPIDTITDNQAAGRGRPLPDGSSCFYYILSDDGFSYVKKKTQTRINSLISKKLKGVYVFKIQGNGGIITK